ncbi:MAG TPA: Hsp20/alpha crystallin family protein [Planctomycetes bacterium]|nr:Hsp20/alpha crystallin family protein [Planctomycetota bacterium]
MTLYSLVPWKRNRSNIAVRRGGYEHPFWSLQRQTNRLFDDLFDNFGIEPFGRAGEWAGGFSPDTNVTEDDKNVYVSAELPGMDTGDIDLSLNDNILVIKGEKKQEQESRGKGCYHIERSYGTFERVLNLPCEVDQSKADAKFEKGVLNITLAKKVQDERKVKKIAIRNN